MAHALNEFLAAANSDTIRCNNQFELYCFSGVPEIDKVLTKATLFGQSFSLPKRGVTYSSVFFKGFEAANIVPVALTMEHEHTMTILCDVDGEIRRAFLAWQATVINPDISGGSVFEGDRGINEKSIVRVHLFQKDNKSVSEIYKLYNVRVSDVGNLTLSYSEGEAAKFDITFLSTYWEIEKANRGALTNQK